MSPLKQHFILQNLPSSRAYQHPNSHHFSRLVLPSLFRSLSPVAKQKGLGISSRRDLQDAAHEWLAVSLRRSHRFHLGDRSQVGEGCTNARATAWHGHLALRFFVVVFFWIAFFPGGFEVVSSKFLLVWCFVSGECFCGLIAVFGWWPAQIPGEKRGSACEVKNRTGRVEEEGVGVDETTWRDFDSTSRGEEKAGDTTAGRAGTEKAHGSREKATWTPREVAVEEGFGKVAIGQARDHQEPHWRSGSLVKRRWWFVGPELEARSWEGEVRSQPESFEDQTISSACWSEEEIGWRVTKTTWRGFKEAHWTGGGCRSSVEGQQLVLNILKHVYFYFCLSVDPFPPKQAQKTLWEAGLASGGAIRGERGGHGWESGGEDQQPGGSGGGGHWYGGLYRGSSRCRDLERLDSPVY